LFLTVSVTGTSLALANAVQVHSYLGMTGTKYVIADDSGEITDYFTSDYTCWEDQYSNAQDLIEQIQEVGSVLLENNDETLPLAEGAKVSLFSRSFVDTVYGGSGSGAMDTTTAVTLDEAMESAGFSINQDLWDFYSNQTDYERTVSDIAEVPISDYPSSLTDSYSAYGDATFVVISRYCGDAGDLDTSMEYLELQQTKKDLLEYANQYFDTVIILINSSNAIAVDWLDDHNVDACLWIGGSGNGLTSVAKILDGEEVPSGKLADEYATSSFSAPAMQNFGDYTYTNASTTDDSSDTVCYDLINDSGYTVTISNAGKYMVYAEGIYVGYKYYETRYEDCVLNHGNADSSAGIYNSAGDSWNYSDEVGYAFGYGLSYTTFSQEIDSVTNEADEYTLEVTVTNTSSYTFWDTRKSVSFAV